MLLWRARCDQASRPGQDREGISVIIASTRHDLQNHYWAAHFSKRMIHNRKQKLSKKKILPCAEVRKIKWAD
jgi:hypothetical protein